jgi:hypothetical protein
MQRTKSPFALNIVKGAAMMILLLSALGVFADSASLDSGQTSPQAKQKQTVTFTGAPASAPDLSTFTVTATSNSGETATITATGSCSVSGDTVTMTKGTGTCSLKASWPANSEYLAATATQKTTAAAAWTESELWQFGGATGPNNPYCNGLAFDKAGNLYGTTSGGGGNGDVFELTPDGQGGWSQTILYSFNPHSTSVQDGRFPCGSLAIDSKGNIYGTTLENGANGGGNVYELSPGSGGVWTETILYQFGAPSSGDGYAPNAGVTLGNSTGTVLYGTTQCGGNGGTDSVGDPLGYSCTNGAGTVYKLAYTKPTKTNKGGWTESIVHNFVNPDYKTTNMDGALPLGGLLLKDGNLYGVTYDGGYLNPSFGAYTGVVYELQPSGKDWTENILYAFGQTTTDAVNPAFMTPVMDTKGNIYGTTPYGGAYSSSGGGTAWELVYSAAEKSYTEQLLYSFGAQTSDGCAPYWQIVPGKTSGTWFGTTAGCGEDTGGTVFELADSKTTGWQQTSIVQFTGGNGFNFLTSNEAIVDKNGNLYGMTNAGGEYTLGNVFELSPIQ